MWTIRRKITVSQNTSKYIGGRSFLLLKLSKSAGFKTSDFIFFVLINLLTDQNKKPPDVATVILASASAIKIPIGVYIFYPLFVIDLT